MKRQERAILGLDGRRYASDLSNILPCLLKLAPRKGVSQSIAAVISVLVVAVIVVAGFIPIAAVARTSNVTYTTSAIYAIPSVYTTSTVYTSYPVSTFTSVVTNTIPSSQSQQVYSLSDYTLNCSSSVYESATLDQGWNVEISYSAGDTITVYLFNSAGFHNWETGSSTNPVATQTGQSSGTFGYNVPLTDTYYLVWDNNLHSGLFCVGGEKVTVTSSTGTATFASTTTTLETETASIASQRS